MATVGRAFDQTHPDGIEFFRAHKADLRIFSDGAVLFHPKVYPGGKRGGNGSGKTGENGENGENGSDALFPGADRLNFKIDENLPAECAALLRGAGFGADTVAEENLAGADDTTIARSVRAEGRVPITLDLDSANTQAYPPSTHSGIIVLRLKRQDKHAVPGLVLRIISVLKTRRPAGNLWIVESDRIRFRDQ